MEHKNSIHRYLDWYRILLRFYPKQFHKRFGIQMEQTFNDLYRERKDSGKGLLTFIFWVFADTFKGIIKENITVMIIQYKNILRIALITAFILLLPLLAMQFTDEVVWDLTDFTVAGALLFGAGLIYELIVRKIRNITYRAAIAVAVVTALMLVWVNLAVGIIGSENNPINLIYLGVLTVGIIGSIIARLQANKMVRALFATALAQLLVTGIALITGLNQYPGSSVSGTVILNIFFISLWVGSALLFRRANAKG